MNPFQEFLPRAYCPYGAPPKSGHFCDSDHLSVPNIFAPEVTVKVAWDGSNATVNIEGASHLLYTPDDLFKFRGRKKGTNPNIKGIFGERMLSFVMESFLEYLKEKHGATEAKVMRSIGPSRDRKYVRHWDAEHAIKSSEERNFFLLARGDDTREQSIYNQEKFGIKATEIDGMGYLHMKDQKYLIIGESTTKKYFNITSWDTAEKAKKSVNEKVFRPIQGLYPEHQLIYFVMAQRGLLFDESVTPVRLRGRPQRVYAALQEDGIDSLFVPLPETEPTLDQLAEDMGRYVSLTKKAVAAYLKQLTV
jgi:hypothetical protein